MMLRIIDRSQFLIKTLTRISGLLERQRGLPILVGIVMLIGSGTLEYLNLAIESPFIAMIQIFVHHFGIITALIGILIIKPLGN